MHAARSVDLSREFMAGIVRAERLDTSCTYLSELSEYQ
jgi:hypothetical protein